VPPLIITLWCLGIAAKALAAYRIIRKGLFERIPILWTFIVISVARSTALLCFVRSPRRYADIAADSMPMMLLSEAFAIVSVFWLLTENFPKWRRPGTISLTVLAVLGTSAAVLLRSAAMPKDWGYGWAEAWQVAVVIQRDGMLVMAVVLVGTRVLLTIVRMIPVRPSARRAADVLSIDVALGLTGSIVIIWLGRGIPLLAYAWPTISGLANGLLLAFWLPAASDACAYRRPHWSHEELPIDWRGCMHDLRCRIRLQGDQILN
jgi:hypothetical protein